MPIDRDEEYGKKLGVYTNDPTEAARDWLKTGGTYQPRESALVADLLEEIDRLRDAWKIDADITFNTGYDQGYNQGYNDAIEAAVGRCHAVSRNQRVTYPWLLNVPMDELLSEQCAAEIATLRRGGSDAGAEDAHLSGNTGQLDEYKRPGSGFPGTQHQTEGWSTNKEKEG